MKFIALVAAITAALPAALAMTVNSPNSVVECEPTQFSWSGGTSPYYLSLIPGGQPAAAPIKQFPTQDGTSYTWNVDLQSGTSFSISLKDSTGSVAYSSIITIQSGPSTSCLNSTVQEGGSSGSSAASTGSAAGSTTSGGSSGPAATSASASASASVASASASSSSSSKTSGAGRVSMSSAFCVAGLMGLVGAALF